MHITKCEGNLFLRFLLKYSLLNISLNYICIDSRHNSHLQDCKRLTLCVATAATSHNEKSYPSHQVSAGKMRCSKKPRRTWFSGHEKDSNKTWLWTKWSCSEEQQESERRRLALDWALMSTSVYGSAYSLLASTGKVARIIAWASLLNDATRLFFENSTLKAYIETQP